MDNFIKSYNLVENTFFKNQGAPLPINDEDFSDAFFNCFDYLSSLKKEEVEMLKSDLTLHCKIVMFNTIKLQILAENPSFLKIPGLYKIF